MTDDSPLLRFFIERSLSLIGEELAHHVREHWDMLSEQGIDFVFDPLPFGPAPLPLFAHEGVDRQARYEMHCFRGYCSVGELPIKYWAWKLFQSKRVLVEQILPYDQIVSTYMAVCQLNQQKP